MNDEDMSIEKIRTAIDDAIDRLWAKGICSGQSGEEHWTGHGIIEGLKRARALTGENWKPRMTGEER